MLVFLQSLHSSASIKFNILFLFQFYCLLHVGNFAVIPIVILSIKIDWYDLFINLLLGKTYMYFTGRVTLFFGNNCAPPSVMGEVYCFPRRQLIFSFGRRVMYHSKGL